MSRPVCFSAGVLLAGIACAIGMESGPVQAKWTWRPAGPDGWQAFRVEVDPGVSTNSDGALRFTLGDSGVTDVPAGSPELPALARSVRIQSGESIEVVISTIRMDNVATGAVPPRARIAAGLVDDRDVVIERICAKDPAIYGRDAYWPAALVKADVAAQATNRWARIEVRPLQYNPALGIIRCHRVLEGRWRPVRR